MSTKLDIAKSQMNNSQYFKDALLLNLFDPCQIVLDEYRGQYRVTISGLVTSRAETPKEAFKFAVLKYKEYCDGAYEERYELADKEDDDE